MLKIRLEEPQDRDAVHRLNLAAFENGPEAVLVDALRSSCEEYLAFVAVEDGMVVGHILFTPVTVDGSDAVGMGLAPMAVLPSHQRKHRGQGQDFPGRGQVEQCQRGYESPRRH